MAQYWCGVLGTRDNLGDCVATDRSDYDRACAATGYVSALELHGSQALIIGDIPLLTSFYSSDFLTAIVSIYYAPDDFDVKVALDQMNTAGLGDSLATSMFYSSGGTMIMFDSALPGSELYEDAVAFDIGAGRYAISTYFAEDIPDVSLIIHAFHLIS